MNLLPSNPWLNLKKLPREAALPDYYAEERQARKRVRMRRVVKLVSLAVGLAALVGAVGICEGRP